MAHLEVELVSTDRLVWSGGAAMVSAPAAEGEIGILVGHSPLVAVLRPGEVRVRPVGGGEPLHAQVQGGFLSVDHDRVTIVAEDVEVTNGVAHQAD